MLWHLEHDGLKTGCKFYWCMVCCCLRWLKHFSYKPATLQPFPLHYIHYINRLCVKTTFNDWLVFSEQKHWQIACCEFITTSESCKWLRIINYERFCQLWLDHRASSLGTEHQESVPDSEDVTPGAITCHHFMVAAAWHSNKTWTC